MPRFKTTPIRTADVPSVPPPKGNASSSSSYKHREFQDWAPTLDEKDNLLDGPSPTMESVTNRVRSSNKRVEIKTTDSRFKRPIHKSTKPLISRSGNFVSASLLLKASKGKLTSREDDQTLHKTQFRIRHPNDQLFERPMISAISDTIDSFDRMRRKTVLYPFQKRYLFRMPGSYFWHELEHPLGELVLLDIMVRRIVVANDVMNQAKRDNVVSNMPLLDTHIQSYNALHVNVCLKRAELIRSHPELREAPPIRQQILNSDRFQPNMLDIYGHGIKALAFYYPVLMYRI